jgi:hypothetical protein
MHEPGSLLLFLATLTIAVTEVAAQDGLARLVPNLSIGCGNGDVEFGRVGPFVVQHDGSAFVYDGFDAPIVRVGPDGRVRGYIGRKGAGPGEFRTVIGMALEPEGNLWVVDSGNQRYSVFASDGTLLRDHRRPVNLYDAGWFGGFGTDSTFYDQFFYPAGSSGPLEQGFVRVGLDGTTRDSIRLPPKQQQAAATGSMRFAFPYADTRLFAFDPAGAIFHAMSAGERVFRHPLEGVDQKFVEVLVRPTRLGTPERDSLERHVTRLRHEFHVQVRDADLPRLRPWLAHIIVTDSGDVWLMHTDSGTGTKFDRYDRLGRPLGQAQAAARIRSFPTPQVMQRYLWAVVTDELDVPCVVRFAVR